MKIFSFDLSQLIQTHKPTCPLPIFIIHLHTMPETKQTTAMQTPGPGLPVSQTSKWDWRIMVLELVIVFGSPNRFSHEQ